MCLIVRGSKGTPGFRVAGGAGRWAAGPLLGTVFRDAFSVFMGSLHPSLHSLAII
jgi:hypothetical protein